MLTGLGAPAELGAQAGLDAGLARADSILQQATAEERVPGAVLLVSRDGRMVHERAFGFARLYDADGTRLSEPEPMTPDHVFDLASVTKVMATTFAVMLLVDRGTLDLDAPVGQYLPAFEGGAKDRVTLRHLLTHGGGLPQWVPVYFHARDRAEAEAYVARHPLAFPVGEERRYSDLGFMLLGYVVERVSGRRLDRFVEEELYAPLGLASTAFLPREKGLGPSAATSHGNPYERRMVEDDEFGYRVEVDPRAFRSWREHTLVGEVNDGNAHYAHGGVAGHAGLFSTARELGVLLDVLLNGGRYGGRRILKPETIAEFLRPQAFGHGLGWMLEAGISGGGDAADAAGGGGGVDPAASADAAGGAEHVFFHPGFTGTWVAGVPELGLSIVLLTNRQNVGVDETGRYPDIDGIRRSIVDEIVKAAKDPG
ncbi:MAG: serine hydrolase domain-containing protein [Myxococcota bacterium]